MAGRVADHRLSAQGGAIEFSLAAQRDDDEIRALLRHCEMGGSIRLSLEREPNYFASIGKSAEETITTVCRENGKIVALGSCAIERRFINGTPARAGYLGELRLSAQCRERAAILRQGYAFMGQALASREADFLFTSIAAENHRARRFLERGLPGMPAYRFLADFVTFLIPWRALFGRKRAPAKALPTASGIVSLLNRRGTRFQLARVWTEKNLAEAREAGLALVPHSSGGEDVSGVWNQRSWRQIVVRGYAPQLTRLRPVLNVISWFKRKPLLPPIGAALRHSFHVGSALEEKAEDLLNLPLRDSAAPAFDYLVVGMDARHPLLPSYRSAFSPPEYRTRLYQVSWPQTPCRIAPDCAQLFDPGAAFL